jgi:hypothetical protein
MDLESKQELIVARRAFDRWRALPDRGARIPEALWLRAVGAAERHGVSRTATVLGLDYYSLQKRVASPQGGGFLEVAPAQLGVAGTELGEAGVVIEVRRDGVELTLRLGSAVALDVGGLCDRLLGGRR